MKCAKDFRAEARAALKSHWLSAVLAGIIAAIFGGCIISGPSGGSGTASSSGADASLGEAIANFEATAPVLFTVFSIIAVIIAVFAVISLVLGGAVSLGYAKYNLNLIDGNTANVEDLISQFNRIGDGFVMRFLTVLYTVLWSLLLVVPGIIAVYSYSMAPYILYENPGMKAKEAIKASKALMKGNKWRLFCLEFSFIGWGFLSALSLGVGMLFLRPYIEAAGAAFYRDIKAKLNSTSTPIYGEYTVSE